MQYLRSQLLDYADRGYRVLIGFDFPYGFPLGFAKAVGAPGTAPAWRRTWNLLASSIKDDAANRNNRFTIAADLNDRCDGLQPGPFWNVPPSAVKTKLRGNRPKFPFVCAYGVILQARRFCESRLRVQEVWKLYTPGSVGSQALVGIPRVLELRDDPGLQKFSRVWPFETGFIPEVVPLSGPFILHAEIWPGIVSGELDASVAIKDQAQVLAMVRTISVRDKQGLLAQFFDVPAGLSKSQTDLCVEEEGWILGAK